MEFLTFVANNWDTVGLLVTNIVALYMNPPRKNKSTRSTDNG